MFSILQFSKLPKIDLRSLIFDSIAYRTITSSKTIELMQVNSTNKESEILSHLSIPACDSQQHVIHCHFQRPVTSWELCADTLSHLINACHPELGENRQENLDRYQNHGWVDQKPVSKDRAESVDFTRDTNHSVGWYETINRSKRVTPTAVFKESEQRDYNVLPGNEASSHWKPVHSFVSEQVLAGSFLLASCTGIVESDRSGYGKSTSENDVVWPLKCIYRVHCSG